MTALAHIILQLHFQSRQSNAPFLNFFEIASKDLLLFIFKCIFFIYLPIFINLVHSIREGWVFCNFINILFNLILNNRKNFDFLHQLHNCFEIFFNIFQNNLVFNQFILAFKEQVQFFTHFFL